MTMINRKLRALDPSARRIETKQKLIDRLGPIQLDEQKDRQTD